MDMARAAAANVTLAAATRRLRRARGGRHPDPELCRERLTSTAGSPTAEVLAATAKWQLSSLARSVGVRGARLVAADARHRAPGRLVGAREKSDTQFPGRVMASQCAEAACACFWRWSRSARERTVLVLNHTHLDKSKSAEKKKFHGPGCLELFSCQAAVLAFCCFPDNRRWNAV